MEQVGNTLEIQSEPKDSLLSLRGIAQVFYEPSAFFSKLKNNPKILIPYIVLAILSVIFFYIVKGYIVDMQLNNPDVIERMQASGTSTEQARPMMEIFIMGGGVVSMLLVPLLGAVLALFWGNFVFAGKARFKQLLSVVLYGEILYTIGLLLHVPLIIAKKSMLVSYSLAVLVADRGPTSMLYTVLSKISIFNIWEIIVIGIGLATVYEFTRNKGYILSVLSIGLLTVFSVLMAWVGTMFS